MWLSGSRFRNRIGWNGRLVPPVLRDLAFDRDDVREHVAMRDRHAFRIGGRAGGEDDLGEGGGRCGSGVPECRVPGSSAGAGAQCLVDPECQCRAWPTDIAPSCQTSPVTSAGGSTSAPTSTAFASTIWRDARDADRPTRDSPPARGRRAASRQPQSATSHSGRFSDQMTTLSSAPSPARPGARRTRAPRRRARDRSSPARGSRRRGRRNGSSSRAKSSKKSRRVLRATRRT